MNEIPLLISLLLAVGLLMVALLTSVFGPPSWLKISAVCAFLGGVAVGWVMSGTIQERYIASLCFGPFCVLFITGIGWKVRRDQGIKWKERRE